MDSALNWLFRNAWPTVYICLGVLIGLCLSMPFGWKLPDVVANLMGGVVGAIGSVGAAFLVLRKQVIESDRQRAEDRRNIEDREQRDLLALQKAVARSLTLDLATAKAFLQAQFDLANGRFVGGSSLRNGHDCVEWCQRQAHLPMAAFDHLRDFIPRLGSISIALVHAYSEVVRVRSIVAGQLATAPKQFHYGEFINGVASQLPQLIADCDTAILELEPYVAVTFHVAAGPTVIGKGASD